MKFLIILTALFFSLTASAGARLSAQVSQYDGKDGVWPTLGLSVDQVLVGPIFLTSWAGYGARPLAGGEEKHWGAGKLGLEWRWSLAHLGAGVLANSGSELLEDGAVESGVYAKVSMRLW